MKADSISVTLEIETLKKEKLLLKDEALKMILEYRRSKEA